MLGFTVRRLPAMAAVLRLQPGSLRPGVVLAPRSATFATSRLVRAADSSSRPDFPTAHALPLPEASSTLPPIADLTAALEPSSPVSSIAANLAVRARALYPLSCCCSLRGCFFDCSFFFLFLFFFKLHVLRFVFLFFVFLVFFSLTFPLPHMVLTAIHWGA